MKAAVCTRYGPPEVVIIKDVPKPTPKPDEVLIRIHAAGVNSGDARIRGFNVPTGMGVMLMIGVGVFRPRKPILGIDAAGVVEAVGAAVTQFEVGDEVFAMPGFGTGTHADYVTMPETGAIAAKPKSLSMAESASLLFGGSTAVSFLKRDAKLQTGERVLINGASGAVGCAAIQIAKYNGAHVTAVCSEANANLVRTLGADVVIDYAETDFTQTDDAWDVVMDNVGNAPWHKTKRVLAPGGRLLGVVSSFPGMVSAALRPRRGDMRIHAGIATSSGRMLQTTAQLADDGVLKPVIDSVFPLDDIVAAHKRVDTKHKVGSVMLDMVAGP